MSQRDTQVITQRQAKYVNIFHTQVIRRMCSMEVSLKQTDAKCNGQSGPLQASSTPLAPFAQEGQLAAPPQLPLRRQASQGLPTHSHMVGGVLLHSLTGLRVNTGTVACGRGSSPAPYSPPSAETVTRGGEGLTLHMCERVNLQLTNLVHSPRKERGCFFSQQTIFRGKTSL